MNPRPKSGPRFPDHLVAAIGLLLLAGCAAARAADAPRTSNLYCLSQTRVFEDGSTFFFDDSINENLTLVHDEKHREYISLKSNAPVIIYYSESAQARVEAAVGSWTDLRGFVHSADILKRQVRYDNWVRTIAPGTSGAPALLALTGILDRPTSWATYDQMRFHLESTRRRLREMCAAASGAACDGPPWPSAEAQLIADALEPARQALETYKVELEGLTYTAPTPYEGLCDDTIALNLDFNEPILSSSHWEQSLYGTGNSRGATFYTGVSAESNIRESVDPASIDPSKLTRMTAIEGDARRRTQYLADLSGDTE